MIVIDSSSDSEDNANSLNESDISTDEAVEVPFTPEEGEGVDAVSALGDELGSCVISDKHQTTGDVKTTQQDCLCAVCGTQCEGGQAMCAQCMGCALMCVICGDEADGGGDGMLCSQCQEMALSACSQEF